MKYFIDTEFMEDGRTIELISIGIVAEDGREFYAVSGEFDPGHANEWVKANVLPQVAEEPRMSREKIRRRIKEFIDEDTPEFWGYYADYDWVVFCWLFGRMIDLPQGWPMYCRDIKQLCDAMGNPKLPDQTGEHHALADAKWNKAAYDFLCQNAEATP